MKVLIQIEDSMLSDIMALAVEGVLSAECRQADGADDALRVLAEEKKIDLLVLESDEGDSPFLREARKRRLPIIRLSGGQGMLRPGLSDREYVLAKPLDVKDFLELVRYVVKADSEAPIDKEYCQVRLDTLLMAGNQFEFEIFLRLSDAKYVKVVSRGDVFDGEKYSHFLGKGIKHLYIPKNEFIQYLGAMANCLHSLAANDAVQLSEALSASTKIYESLRAGMSSIGITPETQRIMKLTVNLAARSIEKNPKLHDLFLALSQNQDCFQAWHSIALCYVSCKLSSLMTWDSQNTHYKLALAGMLHDVALRRPEWALFENESDLTKAGLNEEELLAYRRHPILAGELAKQLDDFPGDVDYIIAQHHELPDGSGFPAGVNHTKISPLSSLFIVSHDICHRLYEEGPNFDFAKFLGEFDERYPLGYFRKIRSSLEQLGLDKI